MLSFGASHRVVKLSTDAVATVAPSSATSFDPSVWFSLDFSLPTMTAKNVTPIINNNAKKSAPATPTIFFVWPFDFWRSAMIAWTSPRSNSPLPSVSYLEGQAGQKQGSRPKLVVYGGLERDLGVGACTREATETATDLMRSASSLAFSFGLTVLSNVMPVARCGEW